MNAVRRVSSRGRLMMAVDLGGTKILAGLISVDGRLVRELRRPVDAWNRSALLTQLVSVVREIQDHVPARGRLEGVGVAVPGAVRPDGTVWAPNLKEWRRVALADHLTKYTGLRAVVENDRLTSLLGEQWCGAARGVGSAVFITIGTGLGAGFMLDRHSFTGTHGVAGSIGWWVLGKDRTSARSAEIGMLEAAVAGPAILRRMRRAGISGSSARELVTAARRGDWRARAILKDVGELVGLAVANLVSLFDPEIVVLGGGVAQAGRFLLDPIRTAVRSHAQPLARSVRICRSALGTRASLFGAAALVNPDLKV
ncbi:MAG: ROK family protein [Bacillati bacterium ANGP1]|uniref:ROK family protein n=1 Tax=Candidatus Segetimicrobium genomatis TaxID=2569760 RepID=A0A537LKT5_9BACT|nr:MAG: ROK family protein [Terrabacteria group bacterium ANGP1]